MLYHSAQSNSKLRSHLSAYWSRRWPAMQQPRRSPFLWSVSWSLLLPCLNILCRAYHLPLTLLERTLLYHVACILCKKRLEYGQSPDYLWQPPTKLIDMGWIRNLWNCNCVLFCLLRQCAFLGILQLWWCAGSILVVLCTSSLEVIFQPRTAVLVVPRFIPWLAVSPKLQLI